MVLKVFFKIDKIVCLCYLYVATRFTVFWIHNLWYLQFTFKVLNLIYTDSLNFFLLILTCLSIKVSRDFIFVLLSKNIILFTFSSLFYRYNYLVAFLSRHFAITIKSVIEEIRFVFKVSKWTSIFPYSSGHWSAILHGSTA